MKKKIIIIGGGFGGLAVACRLAAAGNDVEIFEQRDKLGGRAYVYEINGFKFDAGPTIITAPFLFDDIFQLAGKVRGDYFQLVPVDPFYRIFDHLGKFFDYNNNPELIYDQIDQRNPTDKEGYLRFFKKTKAVFEKGFFKLADKPFLHFTDMLRVAPDLISLHSYKSVYQFVSQLIKDDFLRQVFSLHTLLFGGNPFDTPSLFAMIHYLERAWGVHYALGGTGTIVVGLEKLFLELGGKVTLNAEVGEILTEGRRKVTGVRLKDGSIHRGDIVISNADIAYTYRNLIPENRHGRMARKVSSMKYGASLFVIYFGTRCRYTDSRLIHHNIILGERFKALLDDIFNRKVLADDFFLYLQMPSYTDPSMAPEGCESFYVLVPVPNESSGIDWTKQARPFRDRIMLFLEQNYLPDLRSNVIAEHYIDPLHFRDTLHSFQGAAFSILPIWNQLAWFRPHNRSEEFDNLYFVGAGSHPGAGLPGVLSSSIIVENLIGLLEQK